MRTLRFRLMAWNAFVVVLTGFVTLAGIREGVRLTLIGELDQLLREDLEEIALSLREFGNPRSELLQEQLARKSQGHAQHKWFVQLIDARGAVIYASPNAPSSEELDRDPSRVGPWSLEGWRVRTKECMAGSKVDVRVGASLDLIRADIQRLDRLVGVAAGIVLLVAPAFGYWLAGRATRPLGRIIQTMNELQASRLEQRLPLRGTGDELDRLSLAFNRLLDNIAEYLQERRDFLANSAHELRTPLAAIRSSLEVALAGNRTREEYAELIEEVLKESSELEILVNQLLLLAETEVERFKTERHRVRIDVLMERAVDMFSGVADYRNIALRWEPPGPVEVEGNPTHLRQVFYNLLDNAIKFTLAGGAVSVNVRTDAQAGEVSIHVADTGVGIPPHDLPHVFERFFRGDKARRRDTETRGTGLGLSICQSIVAAHHGRIHVESEVGKGTRVEVILPISQSNRVPLPYQVPRENDGAPSVRAGLAASTVRRDEVSDSRGTS